MAEPAITLNPSLWGHVLDGFMVSLNGGWLPLTESSKWLWGQVATWYAIGAMVFGQASRDGDSLIQTIMRVTIFVAVIFVILVNMQWISNAFISSVVHGGLVMTQGIATLFPSITPLTADAFLRSPSNIVQQGFEVTKPIMEYLEQLGIWGKVTSVGMKAIFEASVAFTCLMYFIIAAHVLVLVIAVRIAVFVMLLFFPFVLFGPTQFMANGAIQDFFKLTVRLAVLAFICGLIVPMLTWLAFPTDPATGRPLSDPTTWTVLSQAAGAFVFAILSWTIPHYMHLNGAALVSAALGGMIGAARKVL